jgi:hypothetical protein
MTDSEMTGQEYRCRRSEIDRPVDSYHGIALLTEPNVEHLGPDRCL